MADGTSGLKKVLEAGEFAVTAELGPPMGCDADVIRKKIEILRGYADGVNVTDNQTAVVRMASWAACIMIKQAGLDPVLQMVCRDRNRIALQSDLLGAAAFGIRNVLCLAGDHQSFGKAGKLLGHPGSKNVYDLDSIHEIAMFKKLRDEKKFLGDDELEGEPPDIFIGAVWTPLGDPLDFRPIRLAKKVDAGAQFIQTQGIYDVDLFAQQMKKAREMGLHEKTHILAGIIVPKNRGMLSYMNSSVAGVTVPQALIDRFPKPSKNDSPEEKKAKAAESSRLAVEVTIELIQACRQVEGVHGVHIQAIEWEAKVPTIVKGAGLFPRPSLP
ncbi:MAG: methylenetetrahydrofolate reductase [Planctomycetota bacterium]